MAEREARERWRPSKTSLVAGAIVIAGFLLTGVSWWFLALSSLGVFGPGVLRELGWLNDQDEFQRRADHRAGYHAFLTIGLVAFVFVAFFRSGERAILHTERLATFFLVLLWFTWVLSSLLAFWGPQAATKRLLLILGGVVLVFSIVSNTGSEWTGWAAMLLQPLISLPFFVLAWVAGRKPRVAGGLLLAVAIGFLGLFGRFNDEGPGLITTTTTLVWLIGPLLGCGVALLTAGSNDAE